MICAKEKATNDMPTEISMSASSPRISDKVRVKLSKKRRKRRTQASGIKVCVMDTELGQKSTHSFTTPECGQIINHGDTVF